MRGEVVFFVCMLGVVATAVASFTCDHQCPASFCSPLACVSPDRYVCTFGSAQGGCSTSADFWPDNPLSCGGCCDTMSCTNPGPTPAPPPTKYDCGNVCPAESCAADPCPSSDIYYCIAGTAAGGCTADPQQYTSSICQSCCDMAQCSPSPPPTGPCQTQCPAADCDDPSAVCPAAAPYLCTTGAPPTPAPPTPAPPTPAPPTPAPPTPAPPTPAPSTPAPPTPAPPTPAPPTPAPPTPAPPTPAPPTPAPPTPAPPTPAPPTPAPPTPAPPTPAPPTPAPPTPAPPTPAPQVYCNDPSSFCSASLPFLCYKGMATGDCSASPTRSSDCDVCCDLALCNASPTPAPTPTPPSSSCAIKCPQVYCNDPSSFCSASLPFLCYKGMATGDCSASPTRSSDCDVCCDLALCNASPTPAPTSGLDCNHICSPRDCADGHTLCPADQPLLCTSGTNLGDCSSSPFDSGVCSSCCNLTMCPPPAPPTPAPPTPAPTPAPPTPPPPCGPCSQNVCRKETRCPHAAPFMCTHGKLEGACSKEKDIWPREQGCDACCDVTSCDFVCDEICQPPLCDASPLPCPGVAPYICTSGPLNGSCAKKSNVWPDSPKCYGCCDLTQCMTPAPTYPDNPWDMVPPSLNCSFEGGPAMAPNPNATKEGGMDVGKFGCRAHVADSCCGMTPRFNWIISTCNTDVNATSSMACRHKYGNTSRVELYYLNTYQFNGSAWVLVEDSSIQGNGGLANLTNLQVSQGGFLSDWDIKFSPTTSVTGTAGVGAPAFMFVVSAKKFVWSSLFLLNQLTLNRGPDGENMPDNCWSSSAGELDFLEPPFWANIDLPHTRLYHTITADAGRCFPAQKNVPPFFAEQCNTKLCCEMCKCPPGTVCFGEPKLVGFQPLGCIPYVNRSQIPKTMKTFYAGTNESSCGDYFGGTTGGAPSNAYFDLKEDELNDEFMYAAVVDGDGVTTYRWPQEMVDAWPGIGKYEAAPVLTQLTPNSTLPLFASPCNASTGNQMCAIHEPSCTGDCPLYSAVGSDYGLGQLSGAFSAQAARDGLNWWDILVSTGQIPPSASYTILPEFEEVHIVPDKPPFNCTAKCHVSVCDDPNHCPSAAPWTCTLGAGSGGCSNDSTFWPWSPHCSSCCDARSCEISCSEQCSVDDCNIDNGTVPCNLEAAPYMCTSGVLNGSCASHKHYWDDVPGCNSCCNVRSCDRLASLSESKVPEGRTNVSVDEKHLFGVLFCIAAVVVWRTSRRRRWASKDILEAKDSPPFFAS